MKLAPTTEQIAQAERLQAEGLCQDSEEWILNRPSMEGLEFIDKESKDKYIPDRIVVGPCPVYSEVMQELRKIDPEYDLEKLWNDTKPKNNEQRIPKAVDAAIEALLYLSEGE